MVGEIYLRSLQTALQKPKGSENCGPIVKKIWIKDGLIIKFRANKVANRFKDLYDGVSYDQKATRLPAGADPMNARGWPDVVELKAEVIPDGIADQIFTDARSSGLNTRSTPYHKAKKWRK